MFFFLFGMFLSPNQAQDVKLVNGGFEDKPRFGKKDEYFNIKGWYDCGALDFKWESPPDIHQGVNRDTSFWGNTQGSNQGKTYLGMVVRESESYESLSQRLAMPLRAGKCYSFSVFLSRSPSYISGVANSDKEKNFTEPTVLRVWGGEGLCDEKELLLESPPIDHSEWREYSFKIEPSRDYRHIRIEAFWKTPLLFPYNGHILVDNASDFKLIPCEENVELYVANKVERAPKKVRKMPAHKAKKKKEVVFERGKKEVKIDTIVYTKPKSEKILSLDRNKLKKGENIRIDKLYFEADTSSINVESFEVLNEVFDFLNQNEDIIIEIQGHTNNIPSDEYCDKLSTARAKAVANYLVSKGIQEERIMYKGWGKRRPMTTNRTAMGRKMNQRVEIKIISIG
ncbi:MAG: OmpA family protein [Saprospiraceae bacterium]|nr:OmpA family protein [Saprospiraceae bacterium]